MPIFEHRFHVSAAAKDVAAFHFDPGAFRQLVPPGTLLKIHRQDSLANGSISEFTLWMGPIPVDWKAEHSDVSETGFTDTQTAGPMLSWVHRHEFEPISDQETAVVDRIDYEHPNGIASVRTRLLFAEPALRLLFAWRAFATRRAVRSPPS